MAATTLSLVARKGGVGRTTVTMNLTGCFALSGVRVLAVDTDGQASLSRALLGSRHVEGLHPSNTIAALFQGRRPEIEDVVHETPFENISLLPANDALEPFARAPLDDTQFVLRDFFEELAGQFDLVLIDTAPNINTLPTWSAVVASDFIVSPVPCDAFGAQSISSVCQMVETIQDEAQTNVRILGYVLNQVQSIAVNAAYAERIRQLHGDQIFRTELPLMATVRESVSQRTPLPFSRPRIKATKLFHELAGEIEERVQRILSPAVKDAA